MSIFGKNQKNTPIPPSKFANFACLA